MSSNKPDTRTRILQAAWHLLEASNGKGVRMTDIAKRAGITRQALYLHFAKRSELLIATTHYVDLVKGSDERLAASRAAGCGVDRLNAFIEAWGGYLPEIHGVGKALLAMGDTDADAAVAWNNRMQDMREGCEAAIRALERDGQLSPAQTPDQATDMLWTWLSLRNWEQLTVTCGWSQAAYIKAMKSMAMEIFVVPASPGETQD